MGRVADLADELLDHVLHRHQTEGAPRVVHDACHVGAAALQDLQRLVQRFIGSDRREGSDPLVLDGSDPALVVCLQDVLDVQVAEELAVLGGDREIG